MYYYCIQYNKIHNFKKQKHLNLCTLHTLSTREQTSLRIKRRSLRPPLRPVVSKIDQKNNNPSIRKITFAFSLLLFGCPSPSHSTRSATVSAPTAGASETDERSHGYRHIPASRPWQRLRRRRAAAERRAGAEWRESSGGREWEFSPFAVAPNAPRFCFVLLTTCIRC